MGRSKKSLKALLSSAKSNSGVLDTKYGSKKIESPGGQVRYVPSYTVDFVEPADVTVVRFDTGKFVESNWNWNRNNYEKAKEDSVFNAVPRLTTRKKKVKDKT